MREDRNPKITAHMAKYLKTRRKELRYSLDKVAERTNISKTHLWEIESGRSKNPTLWIILSLCEAYMCSLNDLLGVNVAQPSVTAKELRLINEHRSLFGRDSDA